MQRVINKEHGTIHYKQPQSVSELAQELGERRIFSAPLVIKPDLEDIQVGEPSPEPSFLGWVYVTTILQAFMYGKLTLLQDHVEDEQQLLSFSPQKQG